MALRTPKHVLAAAGAVFVSAPSVDCARAESEAFECFSVAETRHKIADKKFADPFAAMLAVAGGFHGEPLSAKLCRIGDDFLYEVSILPRDGRLVKVYVDAVSGKTRPQRKER